MNIFRVTIEQTNSTKTLIIAASESEAYALAEKGAILGYFEMDEDEGIIDAVFAKKVKLSDEVIKEIKNYGIYSRKNGFTYDAQIIDPIEKSIIAQEKEQYLKENHLEFDFFTKELEADNMAQNKEDANSYQTPEYH